MIPHYLLILILFFYYLYPTLNRFIMIKHMKIMHIFLIKKHSWKVKIYFTELDIIIENSFRTQKNKMQLTYRYQQSIIPFSCFFSSYRLYVNQNILFCPFSVLKYLFCSSLLFWTEFVKQDFFCVKPRKCIECYPYNLKWSIP